MNSMITCADFMPLKPATKVVNPQEFASNSYRSSLSELDLASLIIRPMFETMLFKARGRMPISFFCLMSRRWVKSQSIILSASSTHIPRWTVRVHWVRSKTPIEAIASTTKPTKLITLITFLIFPLFFTKKNGIWGKRFYCSPPFGKLNFIVCRQLRIKNTNFISTVIFGLIKGIIGFRNDFRFFFFPWWSDIAGHTNAYGGINTKIIGRDF